MKIALIIVGVVIILIVVLSILSVKGIIGGKVNLTPEFDGQLVNGEGLPVSDTKVTQTWKWTWGKTEGTQETTTDAEGNFRFEPTYGKMFFGFAFIHEPVINIRLKAHLPDGEKEFWYNAKHSYTQDFHLNVIPQRRIEAPVPVICDIDGSVDEEVDGRIFRTTCIVSE